MLLEIKDLCFGYTDTLLINNLSFDLEINQISGVIGTNGKGKSTLLKLIMGELEPISGEIWFDEVDLNGLKTFHRLKLGLVYTSQNNLIFPSLTVLENLTILQAIFPQKYKNADFNYKLEQKLKYFELWDKQHEKAEKLSGGQQKILDFIRANLQEGRMYLLDEPTAGVSPENQLKIKTLILEGKTQGKSYLIVEQNLTWLESLNAKLIEF